jgi:ribosomal-protein-alanine N-acetyltransferase
MQDGPVSVDDADRWALTSVCPVELKGRGVALRELRESDAESLAQVFGDPEVVRYLWIPVQTLDSERAFVMTAADEARRVLRREYHLAITTGARDEVVGSCHLGVESVERRSAILGYGIRRDLWGRGIGTEVVRLLVRFGFETLHLHRIWATHHPDNPASGRVLAKAGFVPGGRTRDDLRVEGEWRDSLVYVLLEDEWAAFGASERTAGPTLIVVTGAPGSGKSTVAPLVARALPDVAVFDIDVLMGPVNAMLGVDVRSERSVWPAYRVLWMTLLGAAGAAHRPVVFFANALPSEVEAPARRVGFATIAWLVLDSGDETRAARLRSRGEPESAIDEANTDAAELRHLDSPSITSDSTNPKAVATNLVRAINALLRASGYT